MPKENLINFIKERLTEGFNRKAIKETLLGTGFSQEEVEEAFYAIPEKEQPPEVKIPKAEALPYQPQREALPFQEPPSINKKVILPLILLVGIVVIGGAFAFFMLSEKGKVSPETEPLTEEPPQPAGPESSLSEEEIVNASIVNCGGVEGPPDQNCFIEMFRECKPASIAIALGGTITYYYEIIGPSDNLCAVKSKFIKNPNPDWIDKEMTCGYDNTKDFDTAVKDMSQCEGPLYELLTGT